MNNDNEKPQVLVGRAKLWSDSKFSFEPYQKQEDRCARDVVEHGNSRIYTTGGDSTQSRVIHMKLPANSEDIAADARQQLDELLKKALPEKPEPRKPQGRVLKDSDDMQVRYNARQGRINVSYCIDLQRDADFFTRFYELQKQLSICLHYNEAFLKKQCRALAKCSTRQ